MRTKNPERIDSIRRLMDERKLDTMLLRLPENILTVTDYWSMFGFTHLVFPVDEDPFLIVGDCEEQEAARSAGGLRIVSYPYGTLNAGDPYESVAGILRERSLGKKYQRIGIEEEFETVSPPWNTAEMRLPTKKTRSMYEHVYSSAEFIDVSGFLLSERRNKNSYEIGKIQIANEIGNFGLQYFFDNVRPGVSNIDLVAGIEWEIMKRGTGYKESERVRAFAQVASGTDETSIAYRPNEITTTRRLVQGDLVVLELAVVADGYWCDKTRVRTAGKVTDSQLSMWEMVQTAQERAVSVVKPGVTAGDVDAAGREVINEAGFRDQFLHITGHGLGFRYHEPYPVISPGSKETLEKGMIFSIEPGIYDASFGGIRIEDNVVVTERGRTVLGPFAKELH